MASGVQGLDEVMARLNIELKRIHTLSTEGLVKAAIHIRRETETVPPLTPVDLGNLRASWFIVTAKGAAQDTMPSGTFRNKPGQKNNLANRMRSDYVDHISEGQIIASAKKIPMVIMGYSAFYAMYVHENIGADFSGAWRRKRGGSGQMRNAGPKWFEIAIHRNRKKIVSIVAGRLRSMYMLKSR